MWPNQQFPADMVQFTEEILNGKFIFLCCVFMSSFHSQNGSFLRLIFQAFSNIIQEFWNIFFIKAIIQIVDTVILPRIDCAFFANTLKIIFVLLKILSEYLGTVIVTGIFVMHCAIWYHLYNLKSVKNTHGRVLILVKLQAWSLQLY